MLAVCWWLHWGDLLKALVIANLVLTGVFDSLWDNALQEFLQAIEWEASMSLSLLCSRRLKLSSSSLSGHLGLRENPLGRKPLALAQGFLIQLVPRGKRIAHHQSAGIAVGC